MMMEEVFIMTTKSKGSTNKPYCKRCGIVLEKSRYQIQLTPKKIIDLCSGCFTWSSIKTTKEIKEDCKK